MSNDQRNPNSRMVLCILHKLMRENRAYARFFRTELESRCIVQFPKSEWTTWSGRGAFRHSGFGIPLAFDIWALSFPSGCAGRRTVFKAPRFRLISRVTGPAARRLGITICNQAVDS